MTKHLQDRAKVFIESPIPEGMPYVPGSITEMFISYYAKNGKLNDDLETKELLKVCIKEAKKSASASYGDEKDYYTECAHILVSINDEINKVHKTNSKRPWWRFLFG